MLSVSAIHMLVAASLLVCLHKVGLNVRSRSPQPTCLSTPMLTTYEAEEHPLPPASSTPGGFWLADRASLQMLSIQVLLFDVENIEHLNPMRGQYSTKEVNV